MDRNQWIDEIAYIGRSVLRKGRDYFPKYVRILIIYVEVNNFKQTFKLNKLMWMKFTVFC